MLLDIFNRKKRKGKDDNLYSFNLDEIEEFNKQNKEKINRLNNGDNIIGSNNEINANANNIEKELIDDSTNDSLDKDEDIIDNDTIIESVENIIVEDEMPKFSYINLDKDMQIKIMNSWESVDINDLNKDIDKGVDILNHNYTISYCDDAYKYVSYIRDKYNIVICYLIGFNNEKKGIYNKTIFSNKDLDEWRYLEEYINLLEKVKAFKDR